MNGSSGYDGMISEKFSKMRVINESKCYANSMSDTFIDFEKLNDDLFMIEKSSNNCWCSIIPTRSLCYILTKLNSGS